MSNSAANRGFLFGLTLTELMILFVFLLALLIGKTNAESKKMDERIRIAETALSTERATMAMLAPVIGVDPNEPGYEQAIVELANDFKRLTLERNGLATRFQPITQHPVSYTHLTLPTKA